MPGRFVCWTLLNDTYINEGPLMKQHRFLMYTCLCVAAIGTAFAQEQRDHAVFTPSKNEFFEEILRAADGQKKGDAPPPVEFKADFSSVKGPSSNGAFTTVWHNAPVSQGISGMCWCFSMTSYMESEVHRLSGRDVKLSELYTVYWEYVEKARRFVQERGNSEFGEGSESNAVIRIWKQYGIVPASAFSGLLPGQKYYDHRQLFSEMSAYLKSVKANNAWNETEVLATVRSILDKYIGVPPVNVTVDGRSMSPKEYLANVLKLNLDDYVEILSLMEKPLYKYVEYQVSDNWWHSADYFNVPLSEFMDAIKRAVRKGYSVRIGGDTSEPGYEGHAGMAFVPTFDIPPAYIDETARQFRFSNHTTTDDHGIHIVGITTIDGTDWFLVKDSGSGSRNNSHPGYYYYREDYVKLKIMECTIHKDVVKDLLQKASAN